MRSHLSAAMAALIARPPRHPAIASSRNYQLRAFDGVARMAEIPDPHQPVAVPVEQHEIGRARRRIARIAHQHRGPPVHQPSHQVPVARLAVVAEILRHLAASVHPGLGDEIEPHFFGEHVAHGVEIAGVEAVDIGGEQRALAGRQVAGWERVGLLRQLAQTRASAMQRRFHGGDAEIRHLGDLAQGIAEHVHENDAAALRRRQPHEGAQAGGGELAILRGACFISDHVGILVGMCGRAPGAAAEKIERCVVGDAEHPAFRVSYLSRIGERLDRLDDRLLHHILAVDDGAGHARAVPMQLRPQFADEPIEGHARLGCVGSGRHAGGGHAGSCRRGMIRNTSA